MNQGESIIKKGQVESVEDTADGLRIKVRLKQDDNTPLSKIPYAFPLIPKTFQSVPKEGEGAFIITTMSDNRESQRYYLGPIISQPQYQKKCEYNYGKGPATSTIDGGDLEALEKIGNYKESFGAFPKTEDVAVLGRGTQDIILRENEETNSNEIDIRCGIRKESPNVNDGKNAMVGKVVFNEKDPSYIQLKYKQGIGKSADQEANSVVNIVSDKINVISNQDENSFNLTDVEQLIKEDELDDMMKKLHQIPHGDTLIKLLTVMINAIITHVHPFAGVPPCIAGYTKETAEWLGKLDTILSKHVRIS